MNSRLFPRQLTIKRIQELASRNLEEEICGFVLTLPGKDILLKATNVFDGDKKRNFQVDENTRQNLEELLKTNRNGVVTIYHSHIRGSSTFSKKDLEGIKHCESVGFYANWYLYHVERQVDEWYVPQCYLKAAA